MIKVIPFFLTISCLCVQAEEFSNLENSLSSIYDFRSKRDQRSNIPDQILEDFFPRYLTKRKKLQHCNFYKIKQDMGHKQRRDCMSYVF